MIRLNKLVWQVTSVFAIFGLLLIASCSKDDEGSVSVATVEFTNAAQVVSETAAPVTINIPFSRAAGKAGTITITLAGTAEYNDDFTTSPNGAAGSFELSVSKGQTAAQFTIDPKDNALLEGNKTVVLSISDASSGFEIGAEDTHTITITDDEGPTQVNFAVAASTTAEDADAGIDVVLNLSSPAPGTGTVTVAFTSTTAAYTTNFTTEPAATAGKLQVAVAVGVTTVSFKVKPVDDGSVNASRTIAFALDAVSGAVALGTAITTHTVTITDDETPSAVTFAEESSSVLESDEEIVIPFTLDPQTNGSGTVVITFAGATYGTDFTTEPEAVSGEITVAVATDATTGSFKVLPVDNGTAAADKVVTFTLSEATGVVTLGSADLTHALTLDDDDAVTTIADVREDFPGSTTNITSSLRITGIVTSMNPQVNGNNIWVQDATGGIVVRLVSANNNAVERGDEVSIQLKGGRYAEFSGLLQVEMVPNANVTVIDKDNTLPAPEVVTITQLKTGAYEGKLVSVENVAFVDANGTLTMNQTRVISDGTNTTNVRTESGAPFSGSVMPYGVGTITGLAAENGGAVQIIPIVFAEDVFANNPVGTINVVQALTDFGSVDNDAESASQSYTVTGTSLVHPIVISASTGFKVSSNNTDFSASVTLPVGGGTVYVKFAPVSGVNQDIEGVITHKSLGAVPSSFGVEGTETGNAAGEGTLMIYEVYGGGGNAGATYKNDYVVLYNGTTSSIDLSAYTLQYASATGTSGTFGASNIAPLAGTLDAGKFLLVKLAAGAGGTTDLPTPNYAATPALALGGTGGKIALVLGADPASVVAPMSPSVVDFVGFGNANFYEGTGATPAPSNSTSVKRKTFVDTNDNSVDFAAGPIDLSYLN